jgi:hypothetical protein
VDVRKPQGNGRDPVPFIHQEEFEVNGLVSGVFLAFKGNGCEIRDSGIELKAIQETYSAAPVPIGVGRRVVEAAGPVGHDSGVGHVPESGLAVVARERDPSVGMGQGRSPEEHGAESGGQNTEKG